MPIGTCVARQVITEIPRPVVLMEDGPDDPSRQPDIPAGTHGTVHSTARFPILGPAAQQRFYYLVTFATDTHTWEPFWVPSDDVAITALALG